MIDLIIKYEDGNFTIYEVTKGKKEIEFTLKSYNYEDVITEINERYEYARILCGSCLEIEY